MVCSTCVNFGAPYDALLRAGGLKPVPPIHQQLVCVLRPMQYVMKRKEDLGRISEFQCMVSPIIYAPNASLPDTLRGSDMNKQV